MSNNSNTECSVEAQRCTGVTALGFFYMAGAFPLFIFSAEKAMAIWPAVVLPFVVSITGLGLVARACWARMMGMVTTIYLAIYLTLLMLIPYAKTTVMRQITQQHGIDLSSILVGVSIVIVLVMLPALRVLGYLAAPHVKEAFQMRAWSEED